MRIHFDHLVVQFAGMRKPLFEIPERTIPEGSRLLIRGPSGAGKTTLLHIIAGLALALTCEAVVTLMIALSVAITALQFKVRIEAAIRELGILRALGYSRAQVAGTIPWEGFFVSTLGISLGMVIERMGAIVIPLVWNSPWLGQPPWPNSHLLGLWGGVLLASLLATLLPIARLYRWNSHDALKGM